MHRHIDQQSQQPAAKKTINIIRAGKHITESGAIGIAVIIPFAQPAFAYFTIWRTKISLLLLINSLQQKPSL
jgi:hypothetical protein